MSWTISSNARKTSKEKKILCDVSDTGIKCVLYELVDYMVLTKQIEVEPMYLMIGHI